MTRSPAESGSEQTPLLQIAGLFLRLGATSFGGPAAHIAMMEDEVVRRRGWLSSEHFLDLLSAANLIPGPNSTELAIHIGWARRRWAGLAVAGLAFILPAVAITGAVAWAYVRFGSLPEVSWLLYGVKPVIIAVVAQAIWRLAPRAARTPALAVLGVAAAALAWVGVNELVVLFGAGLVRVLGARSTAGGSPGAGVTDRLKFFLIAPAAGLSAVAVKTLPALFWVFCKIGAVLFGSGYVLVAFLQSDLVDRLGWISQAQLVDAVAVGQMTPGPVFSTATFIGYLLSGPSGALVATAGIFLPAFVFVALSGPLVPRLRASPLAAAFLDGINVASLALMLAVTARLIPVSIVDRRTAALGLASVALLARFRLNSSWLVLGGAAAGWALHALG